VVEYIVFPLYLLLTTSLPVEPALDNVFSYEGNSFPDEEGWFRYNGMDRWLESGWLFRHAQLCEGCPGPSGENDSYGGLLNQFANASVFFVEVVLETNGQPQFVHNTPSGFAVTNHLGASYHFTVGNDEVLFRRYAVPFVYVELESGSPHRFRLELYGETSYILFIDDEVADSGVPEAEFFPGVNPGIVFWAQYYGEEHITQLDYLRFGPIPIAGSLDCDSSGDVSHYDHLLLADYLRGPQTPFPRGWDCADADADTDIDLLDFAELQNAFSISP
jgi:hypothetical protein